MAVSGVLMRQAGRVNLPAVASESRARATAAICSLCGPLKHWMDTSVVTIRCSSAERQSQRDQPL